MGHAIDTGVADASLGDLVARMQRTRAAIARMQADETALLAEAVEHVLRREQDRNAAGKRTPHDLPLREVTSELGAAMRLSDRTVQERMSSAYSLVDSFSATFGALQEGRIDFAHASAIIDAGASISDESLRAEYERIVLDAAQFETPHRLRSIARVVAARIDPTMLDELQKRARGDRRVRVTDVGDGMARLIADLPAVLAHAIHDKLTQMAYEVRAAADETRSPATDPETGADTDTAADTDTGFGLCDDNESAEAVDPSEQADVVMVVTESATDPSPAHDGRTMDELRADILADLLLTGTPSAHGEGDALSAIRAHVQITVPVLTAAGISDEPALLAGYGPIDCETARELASGAPGWDRVMFHPHTGAPLAVDTYRPSAELRRFLPSAMSTADSQAAHNDRGAATSITRPATPLAARPTNATLPTSVDVITSSNTPPAGE